MDGEDRSIDPHDLLSLKRKASSINGETVAEDLQKVEPDFQDPSKLARTINAEVGLPPVGPFESEYLLDIVSLVAEVDSLAPAEGESFVRVDRCSEYLSVGSLRAKLSVMLTKSELLSDEPIYSLGLFVATAPPDGEPKTSWRYPSVSFLVMLINVRDPFSEDSSIVSFDTCDFHDRDECRGWNSLLQFHDVSELDKKGFLIDSCILSRFQIFFDGDVIVPPESPPPFRGLENQGATCYLNGLLQSLFHIGEFRELIYSSESSGDENILSALQTVFFDLEAGPRRSYASSEPLTHAFGWSRAEVGMQQDVQEMNRLLIDRLEELLGPKKIDLKSLFCGKIENFIRCTNVEYQSTRLDEFYDIQLNLIRDDGESITSLEQGLDEFLKIEILEGDNAYDAGAMYGKQRAEKGSRLDQLPLILTFQLMRFQFDYNTFEMKKINSRFEFPEKFRMHHQEFKLYAVLVHSGGVHGGHYYAYIRPGGNAWFKFDDTVVEQVSEFEAIEKNFGGAPPINDYLTHTEFPERTFSAYMLMYVREEVLSPVSLADVNPELFRILTEKSKPPEKNYTVHVVRNSEQLFANPIGRIGEHVDEEVIVKGSDRLTDKVSLDGDSKLFAVQVSHDLVRLDEVTDQSIDQMRETVSSDLFLIVIDRKFFKSFGREKIFLVKYSEERLTFYGVVCSDTPHSTRTVEQISSEELGTRDVDLWVQHADERLENACTEILPDGVIVIFSAKGEDVQEYCERLLMDSDVEVLIHSSSRRLGESRSGNEKVVTIENFDTRLSCSELTQRVKDSLGCDVILFSDDPFDVVHASVLPRTSSLKHFGERFHAVPIPPAPMEVEDRWLRPRILCVRLFDSSVRETANELLYVTPGNSVSDLIEMAKKRFNISDPLRLVDVDIHNCEISQVYRDTDSMSLSALLSWGASNFIINSVRVEPDTHSTISLRCFHFDSSSLQPFGHPFLLDLDSEAQALDKRAIRAAMARKLEVTDEVSQTWILSVENMVVMIKHKMTPELDSTPSRHNHLFIKA